MQHAPLRCLDPTLRLLYVIPAHAGIHPLPISAVLDPGPVSGTGWHFRRDLISDKTQHAHTSDRHPGARP
jgi:hypothetical protein